MRPAPRACTMPDAALSRPDRPTAPLGVRLAGRKPLGALLVGGGGSVLLLVAFVHIFRPDFRAEAALLLAVSWPVYLAVIAFEAANLLASAQKWRISTRHFRPDAPLRSLRECMEATSAGSLLGQVVPPQVGVAGARAALEAPRGRGRAAVWTTIHEQIFDLAALCAVGSVAAVASLARLPLPATLALCVLMAVASLVSVQAVFRLVARCAGWVAGHAGGRTGGLAASAGLVLAEAASAPWRVPASLLALSLLRIALMAGRTLVVLVGLLPSGSLYAVALGFPAVQLVTSLPIAPAGLGLFEWGWTGVLLHAGLTTARAAEIAILLRVVALSAACLILAMLTLRRVAGMVGRLRSG